MKKLVLYIIIVFLAVLFLFPVVTTITNSFMTNSEVSLRYGEQERRSEDREEESRKRSITIIPSRISVRQYYHLLIDDYIYLSMFWNSVQYALIITFVSVLIALPTAYVFAKVNFKFRDAIFFVYIVVMMMPFQVTLLANYIQLRAFRLLDTRWAIILPGIFAPFGVFLLRQFIKYIPDEYIEAVALESNSILDIFRIAVIPGAKPGIIALIVLTFAESWNMVEQPLIFIEDKLKHPLSIALNSRFSSTMEITFSGSVLYIIPIIILYFYFEENIIKGLSNYKW